MLEIIVSLGFIAAVILLAIILSKLDRIHTDVNGKMEQMLILAEKAGFDKGVKSEQDAAKEEIK